MIRRLLLVVSMILLPVAGAFAARFTVTPVEGTPSGTPLRIMKDVAVASAIQDWASGGAVYNTLLTSKASNSDGVVVRYAAGETLASFNGTGQSAGLSVTFSKIGGYDSSLDVSTKLMRPAVRGTAYVPAVLDYNATVLEQRRLRFTSKSINFGNVLKGATVTDNYVVTTTNRNPAYATNVKVGGSAVGALMSTQTLVNSASPTSIPVKGVLDEYSSRLNVRGTLSTVTAEDVSVGDTKAYRSNKVSYRANVGEAKLGRDRDSFTGTVLYGSTESLGGDITDMASLASRVVQRGTLAADTTTVVEPVDSRGRSNLRRLYGAVGSEAVISSTSALPGVSMTWRQRTLSEAYSPRATERPDPALPEGIKWLTSDVVKIGSSADPSGATDGLLGINYVLKMSFDNRINLALDGPEGTVENEPLYIARLAGGSWANAGASADSGLVKTNVRDRTLQQFLADNSSHTLADLVGSWGVEPDSLDNGIGHSWVIVAGGGSGVFAVVPEPSTLLLVVISAGSLLVFGLRRRWSRNTQVSAA